MFLTQMVRYIPIEVLACCEPFVPQPTWLFHLHCCVFMVTSVHPIYVTFKNSLQPVFVTYHQVHQALECGTWYHHPRRLQCVWSRNLIIFKVATWHYRCRHNLKNNCIWDNLQCCLLVPRSPSKPVMLTFAVSKSVIHWDRLLACIT